MLPEQYQISPFQFFLREPVKAAEQIAKIYSENEFKQSEESASYVVYIHLLYV